LIKYLCAANKLPAYLPTSMPVTYTELLPDQCPLVLWQLTETEEQLRAQAHSADDSAELDTIGHPQKRREWLAGRALIRYLVESQVGHKYLGLWKDEHGKPFLVEVPCLLSITHTLGYVAGVLHASRPVGIDMERVSTKLVRTATKYLSEAELVESQHDPVRLAMYWCAKEALFKLHGRKKVSFRDDISIAPFSEQATTLSGTLSDGAQQVTATIRIRWVGDYCLAVAI
jgi:4'-phosphopantetheinyl transferase